ncbi:MAG: metallophosphoesterase [Candidatus Omnitrophota bacterium]
MKIGVISDTHIHARDSQLPQKITEEFKKVDMVIHAGDLVSLDVIDKLRSLCKNVIAVRGNMDADEVRNILPEKQIISAGKYKIGVMHGYGAPANLIEALKSAFKQDTVDIIIFGHSHKPLNEKIGEVLFFNPGSAMDKIFAEYNSYGIIELNDKIEAKVMKL